LCRREKKYKPEDFMDEEDYGEFGLLENKIVTKKAHEIDSGFKTLYKFLKKVYKNFKKE
jgi:hypothetical protein